MDPLTLLQELVSIPGPPGQEERVRAALVRHLKHMGLAHEVDAKGNLVVSLGATKEPKIVVTAHMDEIAMMVRSVEFDGRIKVGAIGGLYPWKIGEGPVLILATRGAIDGVLCFGSIHTEDPASTVVQAQEAAPDWDHAWVATGLDPDSLAEMGVRPGTRVVLSVGRRSLTRLEDLVAGPFLDDRADLVSWLLALEALKGLELDCEFVATVSEEIGGEGALYYMQKHRPDVCIALELGPNAPDAPVEISDQPTVWASDSYSSMTASDLDLVASVGAELELELQFQTLSRGGSDASCAAGQGLCARPITLGLPMENSHGYEIIHSGSMENLARLTAGLVQRLAGS